MQPFAVLSQPSDTSKIWINRQDALRKLAQADSLKTYKQIVEEKQKDINTINGRVEYLKELIKNMKAIDSFTVKGYEKQLSIMDDQRNIFTSEIKLLTKQLKREKRKRVLTGIAGLLTTAVAFYIGSR